MDRISVTQFAKYNFNDYFSETRYYHLMFQMLHPDPEDENEPNEQVDDYGENEDDGAFEDADEDTPDGGGDNGHNIEEPMEES